MFNVRAYDRHGQLVWAGELEWVGVYLIVGPPRIKSDGSIDEGQRYRISHAFPGLCMYYEEAE